MERRLNYNKEVDDLTKINEFFQNADQQIPAHSTPETTYTPEEQTKNAP